MVIAKILVTGASGFVGRHILQSLAEFNHPQLQVVAATRDTRRLPASYTGEVRVGDLRDTEYLDRVLAGIDIICHAAGWSNFHGHEDASRRLYLEPTLDLINRAREWRIARFVNLSSIAVTAARQRADEHAAGTPRRGCAMFNCMIAVENYLQTIADARMSVINLRAGIYCGKDLRLGLLPLLMQRHTLPLISGQYGYLPLVNGQDIAQAFVRAALLPEFNGYSSLNIVGPDVPTQREVMQMLAQHQAITSKHHYLPHAIAQPLHTFLQWRDRRHEQPRITCALRALLPNPILNNEKARQVLGYQPHIGWRSSLEDFLADTTSRSAQPALQAAMPHIE